MDGGEKEVSGGITVVPVDEDITEFDIVGRGIAQWRRERPDIDCSGKAIVGRILRLQDVILRAANATLERHGLRYQEFAVLATLRASGPPFRMSPSRLTETLLLTSGGTSNLSARLEKAGWIRRLADPLDGRAVIVELTETGRVLADRSMRDHADTERTLTSMFTREEKTVMANLLSRMLVLNGNPTTWIPTVSAPTTNPPTAGDDGGQDQSIL